MDGMADDRNRHRLTTDHPLVKSFRWPRMLGEAASRWTDSTSRGKSELSFTTTMSSQCSGIASAEQAVQMASRGLALKQISLPAKSIATGQCGRIIIMVCMLQHIV